MEIILKEKVENLGSLGDVVNVKSGYARNYLVPRGKAVLATKTNKAEFEKQRAELLKREQERLTKSRAQAEKIAGKAFTIFAQAGDEGKLFGSIGTKEIAERIFEEGISVERRHVRMPEGTIRHIGEYDLSIHLDTDVDADIKIVVHTQ